MKRGAGQGRDRVSPLASPCDLACDAPVCSSSAHRHVGCFSVQVQARADACTECKAVVSCSDEGPGFRSRPTCADIPERV